MDSMTPAPAMTPPPPMAPPMNDPTMPGARPTGVTILAVLGFVFAGILVLAGLVSFVAGAAIESALRSVYGDGIMGMGSVVGAALGIGFIVAAAIPLVFGLGFWKGWTWIWWVSGILWALSVLSNLASIGRRPVASIVGIAIYVFLIWYITQKGPQRWFKVSMNFPWAK
jgi:hypothetical protein